ncbi:MAG: FAD-dependent oxidoreductase [Gammaproteobacteria bacterium]|nr:MAG: FAD-dependent oxidoreductase [Gammaproteobacteria bacterium]
MTKQYDLIVIGGGPVGLSTAFQASLSGKRTLVLEQYSFLNNEGSSAGASRQFRLQYAQTYMAELAIASQDYWTELQRYSFDSLVTRCGSLWFGDPSLDSQEGGIKSAEEVMDALDIPYIKLDANEIESKFFFKDLPTDYSGFFQPDGGIINLKATEQTLINQCIDSDLVDLVEWQAVTEIDVSVENSIKISTATDNFECAKLAITTGPYSNDTMALLNLKIPFYIWQMSSAYFKIIEPNITLPTWFVFQNPADSALFYGFPEVDWANPGYVRVATDFADHGNIYNPDERAEAPSPNSLALDSSWVGQHMVGLDDTPRFTSTCLISLAEDSEKELLLDYLPSAMPNSKNVVVYTAGWAGKFIPILGNMIGQMLESELTSFNYRGYSIDRSNFSIDWQES